MKKMTELAMSLAIVALLGAGSTASAVSCGDTITGKTVLTADLVGCATNPVLTVGVGGSLDMNGHRLICPSATTDGIAMLARAKLQNGAIGGCRTAVSLQGDGHKVSGLYVFDSSTGIAGGDKEKLTDIAILDADTAISVGDRSSLKGITIIAAADLGILADGRVKMAEVVVSNSEVGVRMTGDGHKASQVFVVDGRIGVDVSNSNGSKLSEINCSGNLAGINVGGSGNKLSKCSVVTATNGIGIYLTGSGGHVLSKSTALAGHFGILIESDANKVSRNTALASTHGGIYLNIGGDNSLKRNVALGNTAIDLHDNAGCSTNTWSRNLGTRDQSCVE